MPKIGAWEYFAIATVLLGFPYVHALQVRPSPFIGNTRH